MGIRANILGISSQVVGEVWRVGGLGRWAGEVGQDIKRTGCGCDDAGGRRLWAGYAAALAAMLLPLDLKGGRYGDVADG